MTDLSRLGRGAAAVWTRASALQVVTPAAIAAQLYDGHWQAPLPGVYVDGGVPLRPVQWAVTAVLASRGFLTRKDGDPPKGLRAVACARTAARTWGLPLIDDDDPATGAGDKHHHDVAVWRHLGAVRSVPVGPADPIDVLHRHQLDLAPADLERHPSGIWLTSLLRTLFDLTAVVSHEALVCALDHALHEKLVCKQQLLTYGLAHRTGRSARAFLAAVELTDEGSESPAETLARLLVKPHLPGMRTQVRLCDRRGRVLARFDLGDEELRLAVETDGKRWHAGEVMRAKDTRRDKLSGGYGWVTERVTWYELRRRPAQTLARILAAAAKQRSA
jgi:very-short-patch-repair endonuclease